jgi:arylsulfatase A-like enzyme
MNSRTISLLIFAFAGFTACKNQAHLIEKNTDSKPNIIIIYADDLGYGDLSAYGATAISTPNIDFLANNGAKFTNGYATSATCTPSRYAILTGVYPWRNKEAKILPGTAPLIIDKEQMTLPKMLKEVGYQTAIIGKWHLGLGTGIVDWNSQITPSPNEVGFDYSYIMAATQDRVPTVYIKNGNVVNLNPNDPIEVSYGANFEGEPTGTENPELVKIVGDLQHSNSIVNGVPRIGFMKGGKSARWVDEDMADHFLTEVQSYLKRSKQNPFFLCYTIQQPHVPRIPHPRFVGKSGMGPRGDVILEADWCIGELMKTLKSEGLLENTLIIFSSDNGPVLDDGYADKAIELLGKHKPAGVLRGGKYSLFEAGTRVPFFTYWKDHIKPIVSDALVSQVDLLSSLASFTGSTVTTKDSQNMMEVFLGNSRKGRANLVIEATSRTAFREGDWLFIPPYKGAAFLKNKGIETGISKDFQLYNLKKDPQQSKNLAVEKPEMVELMLKKFEEIRGIDY